MEGEVGGSHPRLGRPHHLDDKWLWVEIRHLGPSAQHLRQKTAPLGRGGLRFSHELPGK